MNVRSPPTRMKFPLTQLFDSGVKCVGNAIRFDILRVATKDLLVDPLGDCRPVDVAHGPVMLRLKDMKGCEGC